MAVQASWLSEIGTFEAFRDAAQRDPELLFLRGTRRIVPDALSFAALTEERQCFWVEAPGRWRARIVRKCNGWNSQEHGSHGSTAKNCTRARRRREHNFLFIRER